MLRNILVTLFVAIFAVAAFANTPMIPQQVAPEDVCFGSCESYSNPWMTDNVVWSVIASAPAPFGRAACGMLGNYWYLWGEQNTNVGRALNLTTEAWEATTAPTYGNCNWCGVTTDQHIYIVGRYDGGYGNEFQRFTPTAGGPTGTWDLMAPYPQTACGVCGVWDGGDNIYACGGNTFLNTYKYSISGNAWTELAPLPAQMKYHGGAWINGMFHVIGGVTSPYNLHYAYDPVANTWSTKASVPTPVGFATFSTTTNGALLFSVGGGGGYSSWPATTNVQIYDPTTDSWTQETVIPWTARGLNSAYYVGDGIVYTAGGYDGSFYADAYKGIGFPEFGVDLDVTLTAVNPPINIPAGGGPFAFGVDVMNNTTDPITFDGWTEVILPNGATYGPLITRYNVTNPGGNNIHRNANQMVPGGAPAGNYSYVCKVGTYPNTVIDDDSFGFLKMAGDGAANHNEGWACYGFFDDMVSSAPSEYALNGAFPNPFNPTTTISYTLPEAVSVKLAVYDISGRQVATMVDGFMPAGEHQAEFNGFDLSSGVYFCAMQAGNFSATTKLVLVK
jgi:hypothetical protein